MRNLLLFVVLLNVWGCKTTEKNRHEDNDEDILIIRFNDITPRQLKNWDVSLYKPHPLFEQFLDNLIEETFTSEKAKYIHLGFSVFVDQEDEEYKLSIYAVPYESLYVSYIFQGVFYYKGHQFDYSGPVVSQLLSEEGATKVFGVEYRPGYVFKTQHYLRLFECIFSDGHLNLIDTYFYPD